MLWLLLTITIFPVGSECSSTLPMEPQCLSTSLSLTDRAPSMTRGNWSKPCSQVGFLLFYKERNTHRSTMICDPALSLPWFSYKLSHISISLTLPLSLPIWTLCLGLMTVFGIIAKYGFCEMVIFSR